MYKAVTDLRLGPADLQPLEACEECFQNLLQRFSLVEKQLDETRHQHVSPRKSPRSVRFAPIISDLLPPRTVGNRLGELL